MSWTLKKWNEFMKENHPDIMNLYDYFKYDLNLDRMVDIYQIHILPEDDEEMDNTLLYSGRVGDITLEVIRGSEFMYWTNKVVVRNGIVYREIYVSKSLEDAKNIGNKRMKNREE